MGGSRDRRSPAPPGAPARTTRRGDRRRLQAHRRPGPDRFGKTIVAAHRLRLLQDAGKRAIFIVPALSLIDQSVEKLYAEGVRDVGVIQANHLMTNYARPIQVASVQTLQRREVPDGRRDHHR